MVGIVGSVCVVVKAVVLEEARSSFVVEAFVLARSGSYFGQRATLEDPFEVASQSSVALGVHSNRSQW